MKLCIKTASGDPIEIQDGPLRGEHASGEVVEVPDDGFGVLAALAAARCRFDVEHAVEHHDYEFEICFGDMYD